MASERHKSEPESRVYKTMVRAVLFYGSEAWPLRVEYLRRLQVFDNRCFRSIAGVGWCQRICNETVRKRVFGHVEGTSISDCFQHNKLHWLNHVLRLPSQRLPKKFLFSMPDSEWRMSKGGQSLICDEELGISGCEPASWMVCTRTPNAWLETLQDMAANRSQWRMCCQSLSKSSD